MNRRRIALATVAAACVQGLAGCALPPKGYLTGLQEILARYGVLFFDDENVRDDLFYAETDKGWLDGQWGPEHKIPAPVSTPDAEESQPFFDGETLYFRREMSLLKSRYKGGDMSSGAAWETPQVVLAGDARSSGAGEIIAAGEPTIATVGGQRELYFVFAERVADGSLNLDVGRVPQRSGPALAARPPCQ